MDSLALIDLFLDIEKKFGSAVSLDHIVACKTVGDLWTILTAARSSLDTAPNGHGHGHGHGDGAGCRP